MKHTIQIISILSAAAMTLTACGKNDKNKDSNAAQAEQTTNLKRAKNTVCKRAMPQLNHTLYIRNTLIKYILLQKLWAYVRYQTTSILHLTLSARS